MISNNIPVLSVYCNTPPPQHQLGSAASKVEPTQNDPGCIF